MHGSAPPPPSPLHLIVQPRFLLSASPASVLDLFTSDIPINLKPRAFKWRETRQTQQLQLILLKVLVQQEVLLMFSCIIFNNQCLPLLFYSDESIIESRILLLGVRDGEDALFPAVVRK